MESEIVPNPADMLNLVWCAVTRKFQDKRGVWHGLEKKGWVRSSEYTSRWEMWYNELKAQQQYILDHEP